MIFTNCIPRKNAKIKSRLVIKNVSYSLPSIHSHLPLRALQAGQNSNLIQAVTSERAGNAIAPFGKPSHTKQSHCALTVSCTSAAAQPDAQGPSAGGSVVSKKITAFFPTFLFYFKETIWVRPLLFAFCFTFIFNQLLQVSAQFFPRKCFT